RWVHAVSVLDVIQLVLVGQVEYNADNQVVLILKMPDGTERREPTSATIVEAMSDLKKRSAMSSLSELSGFTGTAPAGPIKKEEDEVDFTTRKSGEMDPNYRREQKHRPEVKAALSKFRENLHYRSKIPRLTPSGEFQEVQAQTLPPPDNPPALDDALKKEQVTGEALDSALKAYHEQHVQPSFNMLADTIAAVSSRKAPRVLRALMPCNGGSDPGFVHKGYGGSGGLGQIVNTAHFERGIDPVEDGKGSRGGGKGKGKVKGKGKDNNKGKSHDRKDTQLRHHCAHREGC
ncbi:unnamed protein product, partial [Symbiodinium sp. KB8]